MHILIIAGLMALAGGMAFCSVKLQEYNVNKLADKYNKPSKVKDITPFTYIKEEAKNIDTCKNFLTNQPINDEIKVINTTSPNIQNLNDVVKENKNLSKEGKIILKAIRSKENTNNTNNETELEK